MLSVACTPEEPPRNTPHTAAPSFGEVQRKARGFAAAAESYLQRAPQRPGLRGPAAKLAYDGLVYCEEMRRTGSFCEEETVTHLQSVQKRAEGDRADPPTEVGWTIEAESGCAEARDALGDGSNRRAAHQATLRLDTCEIATVAGPWEPRSCPADGPTCPDGSQPRVETSGPRNADAARMVCPCMESTLSHRVIVRGRWQLGAEAGPFVVEGRPSEASSRFGTSTPSELPAPDRRRLFALVLGSPLGAASARLAARAGGSDDDRAIACARLSGPGESAPVLGIAVPDAACRALAAPPPVGGPPPLTVASEVPQIDQGVTPFRARFVPPPVRAEIAKRLAGRAPGWSFEIGPLAFARRATWRGSPDQRSAALAKLVEVAQLNLGFQTPPKIASAGEGYAGPTYSLTGSEGTLSVKFDGEGAELVGHVWPIACPSLAPELALKPFLGLPMTRTEPGHTCDPTSAKSCRSQPPAKKPGKLAQGDVGLRPDVGVYADPDRTPRLRCVVELLPHVEPEKPLPAALDAQSAAALPAPIGEAGLDLAQPGAKAAP